MESNKANKKKKKASKTRKTARQNPRGRMPIPVRNASERYRNLKKTMLIEELRGLLPPNINLGTTRGRVMSIEAILHSTMQYMNILTETLHDSNVINGIVRMMEWKGMDTSQFIKEETKKLQDLLDFKVKHQLIPTYGLADPTKKPENEIRRRSRILTDVIETYQKFRWNPTNRQVDALSTTSNPTSLITMTCM